MKKIYSVRGGRFLIIFISFLSFVSILTILIAVISEELTIESFSDLLTILLMLLIFPFIIIHYIKIGYWSYLQIDDLKISNKDYSLEWENVYVTFVFATNSHFHFRVPIAIIYIDDHYLNEDEISKKKYKMFMFVNPRIPERQKHILSRYNKKVKIINKWQSDTFDVFLAHNKQFE